MKFTLVEKHQVLADVITFIWEPEQPVSWQAGQFIQYKLPHPNADDRGVERWFTVSAAPFEGRPAITTRFSDKSSSFKQHLRQLNVGDSIEAGAPEGDFVLTAETQNQDLVFIAGGIGITPFRSMLVQADHDGVKLRVELLYGNRDQASTVFAAELDQLASHNPGLKVDNLLEPKRIDMEAIKALADYQTKMYYVSGPEPMVEAMEKMLSNIGIGEAQQQRDYFPGYDWPLPVN